MEDIFYKNQIKELKYVNHFIPYFVNKNSLIPYFS